MIGAVLICLSYVTSGTFAAATSTPTTASTTAKTKPSLLQFELNKVAGEKPPAQPHNLDHLSKHIEELKNSVHHHDNRLLIENIPNLFACLEDDSEIEDCTKVTNFR